MEEKKRKGRAVRFKTIGDVSQFLGRTLNELKRGEIDINEARARGYLCNVLLSALKDSELEKRIEEIEKKLNQEKL